MARPKRDHEETPETLWVTRHERRLHTPTDISAIEQLDVAELIESTPIPWDIQKLLVDRFRTESRTSPTPFERSHASLQVSLCYYTGFGVPQSITMFLDLLKAASAENYTASALLSPILDALDCKTERAQLDGSTISDELETLNTTPTQHYFAERIRYYQRRKHQRLSNGECRYLGQIINPMDQAVISQVVEKIRIDPSPAASLLELRLHDGTFQKRNILIQLASIGAGDSLHRALQDREAWGSELSGALVEACKCGHFQAAKVLALNCSRLNISEATASPLHWLIMFPPVQASVLLDILLGPRSNSIFAEQKPLCQDFLDYMPDTENGGFYFPEHCLQLLGTPLHWAIRTRNLGLVEGLLDYGADINQRLTGPQRFSGDVVNFSEPWATPLDLAVRFHMPEIVDFLLSKSAPVVSSELQGAKDHSLLTIGQKCLPLSRYVIHRCAYSRALRATLDILTGKYALDINWRDANGYTSLLVAITNPNHEDYVVEELLHAGARPDICTNDGENGAFLIAASGANTPRQVSTLELIAPHLDDINALNAAGLELECHNALHMCGILGNRLLAKAIVSIDGVIIDCRSSRGCTALHKAAATGHPEVAAILVAAGADLSAQDDSDSTPLEVAISNRKIETALVLLEADAPMSFGCHKGLPVNSVLHLASARPPERDSILSDLLDRSDKLRHTDQLHALDVGGYTPLHVAARNGDVAGVKSLIQYGANPNKISKRRNQLFDVETVTTITEDWLDRAKTNRLHGGLEKLASKGELEVHRLIQRYEEILRILGHA